VTAPKGNILITGAAKRVGRVMALAAAKAGWDITVHYNSSVAEAETLAAEIRAMGRAATLVQADLENAEDVERLGTLLGQTKKWDARLRGHDDNFCEEASFQETRHPRISGGPICSPVTALIHNASLFERDENDPDGARHNQVNVKAPLLLTEKFFEHLKKTGAEGCALFLLDNTPLPPFLSRYATSRAALAQKLPDLARAYAPTLRVNALGLGPTLRHPRESEAHFEKLVKSTPLCRASAPEDVAAAALFLLQAPSLTGQTLAVDSGLSLLQE